MAIFDRLDRMTSAKCDRMFAVEATIYPQGATPNGRHGYDATRSVTIVKGILEERPAYDAIETGNRDRSGNGLRTLSHGASYSFSVDRIRYPAVSDVKQGDKLTLDDTRRFQIATIEPDGMSRVVLHLLKA